jgi:hypothetical protein
MEGRAEYFSAALFMFLSKLKIAVQEIRIESV